MNNIIQLILPKNEKNIYLEIKQWKLQNSQLP